MHNNVHKVSINTEWMLKISYIMITEIATGHFYTYLNAVRDKDDRPVGEDLLDVVLEDMGTNTQQQIIYNFT